MILCDTNILIEYFKRNQEIIHTIESIGWDKIAISSVTVMELYYGALNNRELNKIKRNLKNIEIVQVDKNVSELAIELIEKYSKSHDLQIPDAFIASTSLIYKYKLYTLNLKDYKYIDSVKIFNHLQR